MGAPSDSPGAGVMDDDAGVMGDDKGASTDDQAAGDAFPDSVFASPGDAAVLLAARGAYLDSVFADMLGFSACKMIRRIVGFAHVADFERVHDTSRRAKCEAAALSMARLLLTHPEQFRSLDDVLDAVPRMVAR